MRARIIPDWRGDFDDHRVWHNDSWWHLRTIPILDSQHSLQRQNDMHAHTSMHGPSTGGWPAPRSPLRHPDWRQPLQQSNRALQHVEQQHAIRESITILEAQAIARQHTEQLQAAPGRKSQAQLQTIEQQHTRQTSDFERQNEQQQRTRQSRAPTASGWNSRHPRRRSRQHLLQQRGPAAPVLPWRAAGPTTGTSRRRRRTLRHQSKCSCGRSGNCSRSRPRPNSTCRQQQALERTQAAREQAVESRHNEQLQASSHPNPEPPPLRIAPPPPPQFHGNPIRRIGGCGFAASAAPRSRFRRPTAAARWSAPAGGARRGPQGPQKHH